MTKKVLKIIIKKFDIEIIENLNFDNVHLKIFSEKEVKRIRGICSKIIEKIFLS